MKVTVPGGRVLSATPVFDTYWRFAYRRQDIFLRRVRGEDPPWTDDPILAGHRFTNAYRASDRVSQYLIKHVIYEEDQDPYEVCFRILLFKLFNRIETWEALVSKRGPLTWERFDMPALSLTLDRLYEHHPIYSAAYIMPTPPFGAERKHTNHLRLIQHMMLDALPQKLNAAESLEDVYNLLRGYPSLGDFLAFQLAIDLNYSEVTNFSEMDFVVAGPGALRGIAKAFTDTAGLGPQDVIKAMTDIAEREFERLGLPFHNLWGRPLQLIDCQNLFCETDKYSRVAHPEVGADSGRSKIKQKFSAEHRPIPQWYPPKWGLTPPVVEARPGLDDFLASWG